MKQTAAQPRTRPMPSWLVRARLLIGWDHQAHHAAGPLVASRRRLVLVNLAVVSLILAVMALAVYLTDTHVMRQQIDRQLMQWAQRDWATDYLKGQHGDNASPNHEAAEQYEPSSPNLFALVLDSRAHVVYDPAAVSAFGLPDLVAARQVLSGQATSDFTTINRHGTDFRLYTIPLADHGQTLGVLQVGASLAVSQHQASDLVIVLTLVGLGVLLLTALASVFLANRAIEPMRLAFERQRQFAAAASHELRTPLAIVRSQAELVARRLNRVTGQTPGDERPGDERQSGITSLRAEVDEIVAEVDYMSRLVHDLLLLARSGGEGVPLHRQALDLGPLVEDVVRQARVQANARDIQLTLERHEAAGDLHQALIVEGDADRLRQLTLILLENAIRYTPPGGEVTVGVTRHRSHALLGRYGERICLSVRDTGVGIAAKELPRIFEPFYRARHATAPSAQAEDERHGSAGLGLALAQWIVQAHGGDLTVESNIGAGSLFTVALPADHAPIEES